MPKAKEQQQFAEKIATGIMGWKPGPAKKTDKKRTAWVDAAGEVRALRATWLPQVTEAHAFEVLREMVNSGWRTICEETPRGFSCEMQPNRGGAGASSFSDNLAQSICQTALAVMGK